jgi:hypothetical protein
MKLDASSNNYLLDTTLVSLGIICEDWMDVGWPERGGLVLSVDHDHGAQLRKREAWLMERSREPRDRLLRFCRQLVS